MYRIWIYIEYNVINNVKMINRINKLLYMSYTNNNIITVIKINILANN